MDIQTRDNKEGKDKKTFTIIVNGRPKEVTEKEMSFEQIISLAFQNPPFGANTIFTITYRKGEGNKPEGSLVAGNIVKLKEGTIFNVTATDKS